MVPISDPMQIEHPQLRECAVQAAWIAQAAAAVAALEELIAEPLPLGPGDPWPSQADPLAVAHSIVRASLNHGTRALNELLADWLAEDPEHWAIFRLMLLDPWQPVPGQWRDDVPGWVFILGTKTAQMSGHPQTVLWADNGPEALEDPA